MKKPVPDFAVFQDSKRLRSAIWTKEEGQWRECEKHEYPAMLLLVTLLRESPDPVKTMEEIVAMMQKR